MRVVTNPFRLDSLPPELLLEIFDGSTDLELTSVRICRRLLPFFRQNLYRNVNLLGLRQLVLFGRTVGENEEVANLVDCIGISYRWTPEEEEAIESESESESEMDISDYDSDSLSSPLSNLNLSSSFKQKLNLSEALDEDRLISFFRRLKNLTQLLVVGRKLAVPLKPRFYIPGVASKLDFVAVHLRNGESTYEDEDDNLLFSAYALPALTKLTLLGFTTFTHHWPSVTPNGEPSRPLEGLPAKRSWGLTHLVLDWYGEIPPLAFPFGLLGVRNNSPNSFNSIPLLFRSFNSLQCLTLNLQQCPPNLGHFLSFLPSTLLSLSVRIGRPIHHTHPIAPVMPKLDNIPQLFPSIRHLKLGSEIFTSKLITSLSTATSLGCIHFDVDAPLFPIHLGDLIAGPNRSPTLVSIEISICHDDHDNLRPPGARKSPQWDTGMTKTQAKAFVKLAEVSGVKVIGSVLCALKICGGQGCGGHVCARCP